MRWAEVVDRWVADGLITEAQAPALREWLETNVPRTTPLADVALTVVALAGAWLLTGASVLFVVQLEGEAWQAGLVALISAAVWAGTGLVAGRTISPPVGQGLLAASVVIAPAALLGVFEAEPSRLDLLPLLLTLAPAVVGTAFAVVQRQTTLAVAASVAASIVLVPWVHDVGSPLPELLFGLALVYAAIPNALAYRARHETDDTLADVAGVLQGQVAFATVIGLNAAFAHGSYGVAPDAWLWESGVAITVFGLGLLGAGALGSSRMTLVSGLVALVTAEITFLTAFGDVMAAIVILGTEGLALIAAAGAAVAARASYARRGRSA